MTMGASTSPLAHHLVEGEAEAMALAEAHPADAGGQALEGDALARHVEPVVQMRVVGRSVPSRAGVGLVDVLGVSGEGGPSERAYAAAEERPDIGWHEARELEGVLEVPSSSAIWRMLLP